MYKWEMGDGTTLFGKDVVHCYNNVGTYQVRCTLLCKCCQDCKICLCPQDTDGDCTTGNYTCHRLGDYATSTQMVTIINDPTSCKIQTTPGFQILFTSTGNVSSQFQFSFPGMVDHHCDEIRFGWDFGDGNTGLGQSVAHNGIMIAVVAKFIIW